MIKKLLSLVGSCAVGATLLIFWAWPQIETELLPEFSTALDTAVIRVQKTPAVLGDQDPVPSPNHLVNTASPSAFSTTIKVKRVIDGDTIELENGQKVRYIGINTPETKHPTRGVECFGLEATQRNKELVENKIVSLEKDVSETDRYGRLLRYVWVDGVLINKILVTEGFAWESRYPPDIARQHEFQKAQLDAEAVRVGLWGSCPSSI